MNHEQIAVLAYRLWEERGCPDGSPELDWERAETMLRQSTEPEAHLTSGDGRSMGSLEGSDSTNEEISTRTVSTPERAAGKDSGAQRAAKRRRRDEVRTSGEGSSASHH